MPCMSKAAGVHIGLLGSDSDSVQTGEGERGTSSVKPMPGAALVGVPQLPLPGNSVSGSIILETIP